MDHISGSVIYFRITPADLQIFVGCNEIIYTNSRKRLPLGLGNRGIGNFLFLLPEDGSRLHSSSNCIYICHNFLSLKNASIYDQKPSK